MIRKGTRRQIRREGTENYCDHRGDFETCPTCDYKMPQKQWDKAAHTLVLNSTFQKSNSVILLTDCPKCFSMSWVHWPIDAFYEGGPFPKRWVNAAKAEGAKRIEATKKLIDSSLCKPCRRRKGDFNEWNGWRSCICGCGGPETECKKFSAKKGKK